MDNSNVIGQLTDYLAEAYGLEILWMSWITDFMHAPAEEVERVYGHRLGGEGTAQPGAVADLLAGEREGCRWFTKTELAVTAAAGNLAAKGEVLAMQPSHSLPLAKTWRFSFCRFLGCDVLRRHPSTLTCLLLFCSCSFALLLAVCLAVFGSAVGSGRWRRERSDLDADVAAPGGRDRCAGAARVRLRPAHREPLRVHSFRQHRRDVHGWGVRRECGRRVLSEDAAAAGDARRGARRGDPPARALSRRRRMRPTLAAVLFVVR